MSWQEAPYPNGSWQVQQCHLQVVRIGIRVEIPGTEAAAWALHPAISHQDRPLHLLPVAAETTQ